MEGVFAGFATIGAVIAVGFLLAHLGVIGAESQLLLSRLAFFVASPALMVTVLGDADVTNVLSRNLVASVAGIAVSATLYLLAAWLVWHKALADATVGTLCAVYVNAGNLGLPIASYVLGDAALIAPMLLTQLLVMQPLALAVLDHAVTDAPFSLGRFLASPFTNPLTVGSMIGLVIALTGVTVPAPVHDPLELIGGMAVPAMLLAYGVSLRLGPRPGHGTSTAEISYIAVLKLLVQPVVAFLVGRFVLDLGTRDLLAVAVIAALPTAQNIFVHATRYGRSAVLARDSIFVTTLLSAPVIIVIAALLT